MNLIEQLRETIARFDKITQHLREIQSEFEGEVVTKLTNREQELFELLGKGLSTDEIAHKLKRSKKTIESHRDNLRKKMRLGTAEELIKKAQNLG